MHHDPNKKDQKSTAELLHEGNPSPAAAPCRNSTKPSPRQTCKAMVVRLGANFFEFSVFCVILKYVSGILTKRSSIWFLSIHEYVTRFHMERHMVSHGVTSSWPPVALDPLQLQALWAFSLEAIPADLGFFPNKSYQIPTSSFVCSLLWDSTLETSRNLSYRIIHAKNTPCPKNPRTGCLIFNTTLLNQHFPWSPDNLRNLHRVWNLERLQICHGGLQKKHDQTGRITCKCNDFNEELSQQIQWILFAQEPNRISQSVLQIPSGCWPQIP